jgi:hypothetical protein
MVHQGVLAKNDKKQSTSLDAVVGGFIKGDQDVCLDVEDDNHLGMERSESGLTRGELELDVEWKGWVLSVFENTD